MHVMANLGCSSWSDQQGGGLFHLKLLLTLNNLRTSCGKVHVVPQNSLKKKKLSCMFRNVSVKRESDIKENKNPM